MLVKDRLRIVLDTSVLIRGLIAKKEGRTDSPALKILRQLESNHVMLMSNSRIMAEHDSRVNEKVRAGLVTAEDANWALRVIREKGVFGRLFVEPVIDVTSDPTDNIYFISSNCLEANFLITDNERHFAEVRQDIARLGLSLQIVRPDDYQRKIRGLGRSGQET